MWSAACFGFWESAGHEVCEARRVVDCGHDVQSLLDGQQVGWRVRAYGLEFRVITRIACREYRKRFHAKWFTV